MDWVFREPPPIETPLRAAIRDWHRLDETEADVRIVAAAELPAEVRDRIGITRSCCASPMPRPSTS